MSAFPQVPGYELQGELGRGGMAVVYSAIETNLGRQVAIKVVTAGTGDLDDQIERLENEARGMAALQHPHIVGLYRFGRTADGSLYYVMPLLPGGSLEDWAKPAAEDRVISLLDNLLDALGHAHAADIIHRDIKPANILFDRHDRPLLADFGAALMRRRVTRLTMHGAVIGSSGCMSPEQARGLEADARSDLYSTAVLAFELLTGKRPFEGPDDLSIAIAQTEQPVPTLPPALRHWQAFFVRALAVSPEKRFPDAAAMRAAIHSLRPLSPDAPHRRHVWFGIAGLAVLLAMIALVFGWRNSAEPVRADSVAALLEAGRLTPPDEPSALAELARARGQELDRAALAALQDQLLATLARDVGTALDNDDAAASATAWGRWRGAVEALEASRDAPAIAQSAAIESQLSAKLADALARYDRSEAAPALAVVKSWDAAPQALRGLADEVRAIVAIGDHFTDPGGPELVLARESDGSRPALAVMAAPVDVTLYQRYVADRGRTPVDCANASGTAQGCMDLETATDISRWLSEQTSQPYRVPTREELGAIIAHVGIAPGYAWTSTCNEVRVARPRDAASRTWSGVRKLFGRRPTQQGETRCDGHYLLKLDGGAAESMVLGPANEETMVVLVREFERAKAQASERD